MDNFYAIHRVQLLEAALKINRSLGFYADLSFLYLKEKGEDGVGLIASIVDAARDVTFTRPGMLGFGNPCYGKPFNNSVDNDDEIYFNSSII